jgi:hypothetical protein
MIRKQHRYPLAFVGWFVLLVAAFLAVNFRVLGPEFPYDVFPGAGWRPVEAVPADVYLLGTTALLGIGGLVLLGLLQKWSWLRTGRPAGLSSDGGLFPSPTLSGTVRGRNVRARTIRRRKSSNTARNDTTTTSYTVVEADLDAPVADGFAIERRLDDAGMLSGVLGSEGEGDGDGDGDIELVGETETVDPDVLSRQSRDALVDPTYFGRFSVGAVPDDRIGAVGTPKRTFLGAVGSGTLASTYSEDTHGDAGRITHESTGVILDAAEMERQVEAVVAVAEAVQEARRPAESS